MTLGTNLLRRAVTLGVGTFLGALLKPSPLANGELPGWMHPPKDVTVSSIKPVKIPQGRSGTLSPYERAHGWYQVVTEGHQRQTLLVPRGVLARELHFSTPNLNRLFHDTPWQKPELLPVQKPKPVKKPKPVELPDPKPSQPRPKPLPRPKPKPRPKPRPKPSRPSRPAPKPSPRPKPKPRPPVRPKPKPKPPVKPVRPPIAPPKPVPPAVPEVPEWWTPRDVPPGAAPWSRPEWDDTPRPIPYPGEVYWPETVIEGRLKDGMPQLRVRMRPVRDALPRRSRDEKPRRRGGLFALHTFITATWGAYTEAVDVWELLQENLYTRDGTRVAAIRGRVDPVLTAREWIKGNLRLDAMGFLEDFAVNQFQDEVIGRMNRAITKGTLRFMGNDPYSLTTTQRLNQLRRSTAQIQEWL